MTLFEQVSGWCYVQSVGPPTWPVNPAGPFLPTDVLLVNNGAADEISFWGSSLGPQPTAAQLAAITVDQVAAAIFAQVQSAAAALFASQARQNYIDRAIAFAFAQYINNQILPYITGIVNAIIASGATLATIQAACKALTVPSAITYSNAKAAISHALTNGDVQS